MIDELAWVNVVWALSLWLSLPIAFRFVSRRRAPEVERALIRFVLCAAPLILVLVLFIPLFTPEGLLRMPLVRFTADGHAPVVKDAATRSSPASDASPETVAIAGASHAGASAASSPEQVRTTMSSSPRLAPSTEYAALVNTSEAALPERITSAPPHLPSTSNPASMHMLSASGGEELSFAALLGKIDDPSQRRVRAAQTPQPPAAPSPRVSPFAPLAKEEPRNHLRTLNAIFISAWAALAALACLRFARAHAALRRISRAWRPAPAALARSIQGLAQGAGHKRDFAVLTSSTIAEPAAAGAFHAALILPERWCERGEVHQRLPLVLHEIAHLRTRDPLYRRLALAAGAILWPHPLAHTLIAREMELSEEIADRFVLSTSCTPRDYATLITRIAEERLVADLPPFAIGLFGTRNHLEGRIRMILATNPAARRGSRNPYGTVAVLLAALAGAVVFLYPLVGFAQDRQARRAPAPPTRSAPPVVAPPVGDPDPPPRSAPPRSAPPRSAPPIAAPPATAPFDPVEGNDRDRDYERRIAELEQRLEAAEQEAEEKEIERIRSDYDANGGAKDNPPVRAEMEAVLADRRADHLRARLHRERERALESRRNKVEAEYGARARPGVPSQPYRDAHEELLFAHGNSREGDESRESGGAELHAQVRAISEQIAALGEKVAVLASQIAETAGNHEATGRSPSRVGVYAFGEDGRLLPLPQNIEELPNGTVVVRTPIPGSERQIEELQAALAAEREARVAMEHEMNALRSELETGRSAMEELRNATKLKPR